MDYWIIQKHRENDDLCIDMLHAILTAGMGDRYMVVAHNPIVKKAISKEKLTKRGLVSLLDYYLKVAHS